jgi:hypothetical protein
MKDVHHLAVFMHQKTCFWFGAHDEWRQTVPTFVMCESCQLQRVNASSGFGANYMLDGGWKMHFGQHIVCVLQECFCTHLLDSLCLCLTNGAWKTGFPMSTMGTGSGDECKEEVQQMLTPLKQGARKNGGVARELDDDKHCIDGNRQLWGTHSYAHSQ